MSDTFINLHFRHADANLVTSEVSALFGAENYNPVSNEPASLAVAADDEFGEDAYGFMVSGVSGAGWVSVYVDDWVDSGWIAKKITAKLDCRAVEIWAQDGMHWGYTLYGSGEVADRFTDDPYLITDDPREAELYTGDHEKFAPLVHDSGARLKTLLDKAQEESGQEVATRLISEIADILGIPFEHALMSLDDFFEEDPEDYVQDLENWDAFQFLTFTHPDGRTALAG